MLDNKPPPGKRKKGQKIKNIQVSMENLTVPDNHQHDAELPHTEEGLPRVTTIKIQFHPAPCSDPSSESSSSQPTAVDPPQPTGEASGIHHRGATLDRCPTSNKRTAKNNERRTKRKRNKRARQALEESLNSTSTHQALHNDADFTLSHSITFHPSNNEALEETFPQFTVNSTTELSCEATTSTHDPPPCTAKGQSEIPDKRFQEAEAGPSECHAAPKTVLSSVHKVPSKYLAIDCEMVGSGPKGHVSQVARCSIVSYNGDVVYDKFIKPPVFVTDFRTRWSGIRPRDLRKATPYTVARKEILNLVHGKVLIGHAIHNDLKVLNYSHPKELTRDTSRIPLLNIKAGFKEREVVSLKRLTKALLKRDIQAGKRGHSSVEDAKATMELYRMVEVEWE